MCDTCRSEKTLPHTSCTQFHFSHRGFVPRSRIIPAVRADRCRATRTESKLPFIRVRIFQPVTFPSPGGQLSPHQTTERRGGSGNFPSARALRTDLSRPHTHAQPPPPSFTHTKARASRAISRQYCVRPGPAAPGSYSVRNFFSPPPPAHPPFLNEKREKKGGEGVVRGCAGATVSAPFLVA